MTQQPYSQTYPVYQQPKKNKVPGWVWALIVTLLVVGIIVGLSIAVSRRAADGPNLTPGNGSDYVAVLHVEGTMTGGSASSGLTADDYDQEYLLSTIDFLKEDDRNLGLLLYIDSPGGEVMAASDLADAVMDYREATGRPIYAYGHNYAASGGYWLAAAADRFFANRYCITGSIGVTYGTMFDFSGLLEKYGVKTNTITSGAQKAMGSSWEEMTPETRAIFQSIIDEYYGYFVDWVSTRRGMDPDQVRQLADGRIYTATQAVANGLADEVGDYQACLDALLEQVGPDTVVEEFQNTTSFNWLYLMQQNTAERELNSLLPLVPPGGVLAYCEF